MPLHTSETSREHNSTFFPFHIHRTALPSVGAHVHYLCCRRSTSSEVYCCWVGTFSSCVAYITILGIPGWAPTEYEWPKSWTSFHLGCNPSLQVWLPEIRRQAIHSCIRRVSRLDWEATHTWQVVDTTLTQPQ